MKKYLPNFDEVVIRRNTGSLKWDGVSEGSLPMWVADMDFVSPQEVVLALQTILNHGVFGYPLLSDDYFDAVITWFDKYHNVALTKDNIIAVGGVVPAVLAIIQALSTEGEHVIIQSPVYGVFINLLTLSQRNISYNPLVYCADGRYTIDFGHLEGLIKFSPKVFLLCSPHNPVGRVWTYDELIKIGDFCIKHEILLIVDEIHGDLIMPGFKFISYASLPAKYLHHCVIVTSPTKTFNLAGIRGGNVLVFNAALKERFIHTLVVNGLTQLNCFYIRALIAVYTSAHYWLVELIKYLSVNQQIALEFIQEKIPELKVTPLQATYLLWINYDELNISEEQLFHILEPDLIASKGSTFGPNENKFFRLNIACARRVLLNGLIILERKVKALNESR